MFALWGLSIAAALLMYALGIDFERRGALVLLTAVGGPIWIPIGLLILWAVLRMDESTVHHEGGGR